MSYIFHSYQRPIQNTSLITPIPNKPLIPHILPPVETHLCTKKKYKPVALKIKPVIGELPDKFRIIWEIKGDHII